MTSIFSKMEDDLIFFENGRRPQVLENGRQSTPPPSILKSKPNPPILELSTAQVIGFLFFFTIFKPWLLHRVCVCVYPSQIYINYVGQNVTGRPALGKL